MENNELKPMLNKIFICLVAILTVLIINSMMLATTLPNSKTNNNEQEINSSYDISKLKEIQATELLSNTKNKNTVVYIGRESCSWCVKFIDVLNNAINTYQFDALYIDIAKLIDFSNGSVIDQENYDTMLNLNAVSELKNYMNENFGSTPMVLIIKDNKIIDAQTGYVESEEFNSFLERNNIGQ